MIAESVGDSEVSSVVVVDVFGTIGFVGRVESFEAEDAGFLGAVEWAYEEDCFDVAEGEEGVLRLEHFGCHSHGDRAVGTQLVVAVRL